MYEKQSTPYKIIDTLRVELGLLLTRWVLSTSSPNTNTLI